MDEDLAITSNGTPHGTSITWCGQTIPARAVQWEIGAGDELARATVELDIVQLEAIGGAVEWSGLENVPIDALKQELERRQTHA